MKNYFKALIILLCLTVSAAAVAGCGGGSGSSSSETEAVTSAVSASADEAAQGIREGGLKSVGLDPKDLDIEPVVTKTGKTPGFQLEKPKQGDTVAVVRTNMGDFKMKLFTDEAPRTVTNFINLVKQGKYDNTIFHRVVKDFVVQGGHIGSDPSQPNGESSYGAVFDDEFCDSLFNLRGAVSMANSGKDTNGSQFFINQINAEKFHENGGWAFYDSVWKDSLSQLKTYKDNRQLLTAFINENGDRLINTDVIPKEVKSLYVENGGNPNLDGAYNAADRGNTVFAQVFEGMEVVDKIAAVKVSDKFVPDENVVIKSIEITTYTDPAATQAETAQVGTTAENNGEASETAAEEEPRLLEEAEE